MLFILPAGTEVQISSASANSAWSRYVTRRVLFFTAPETRRRNQYVFREGDYLLLVDARKVRNPQPREGEEIVICGTCGREEILREGEFSGDRCPFCAAQESSSSGSDSA